MTWGRVNYKEIVIWKWTNPQSYKFVDNHLIQCTYCVHTSVKVGDEGMRRGLNVAEWWAFINKRHKLHATQHMTWHEDMTWMHAADKNTNCVQTTRHVDRRAHGRANSRPHVHTTRQNMERECPNPYTNRNSRHESRHDPNTTIQHETKHADERAHGLSTLEATHSHKNRTWHLKPP